MVNIVKLCEASLRSQMSLFYSTYDIGDPVIVNFGDGEKLKGWIRTVIFTVIANRKATVL